MRDSTNRKRFEGCHILLELQNVTPSLLSDKLLLEKELVEAAVTAGATVVKTVFHQFNPHGLSGVIVIAESHIAIHTWPEHGHACVDVFTCGKASIAHAICDQIITRFQCDTVGKKVIGRGSAFDSCESTIPSLVQH